MPTLPGRRRPPASAIDAESPAAIDPPAAGGRSGRAAGPAARRLRARGPAVAVFGDLMLDVVLDPSGPLRPATDTSGVVSLRQGGSAATTARWLAQLGVRSSLVCAVGRDAIGRALVDDLRRGGVAVRAVRSRGVRTGRIGVVVGPTGERSFVTDRGAADRIAPADLRPTWFAGVDLLHVVAYAILTPELAPAAGEAIGLARAAGALVSLDLASAGPIRDAGRRRARAAVDDLAPDVLFATADEARALLGAGPLERLLEIAPLAVVKRGALGATVVQRGAGGEALRFEVAARRVAAGDTTGAGDAFDAGFLAAWLAAGREPRPSQAVLHRAVLAGHRAAFRQLTSARDDLAFG